MDLTSKKEIIALLDKHQAQAQKSLGQNFIINRNSLERMILGVENQVIVEVGPGLGTLTRELSLKNKKVVAFEKDFKMVEILKETLKDLKNVEVIAGDILKKEINSKNYYLVANLPYYISTAVIRKFLEQENKPQKMILTVQKEVAQRICSSPPRMSLLSLSVQFYAQCKILFNLPRNSFWPTPKVDSSVIEIVPKEKLPDVDCCSFFSLARAGFSRPRAQLLNNISKKLELDKSLVEERILASGINPKQRAETLKVEDWVNLTNTIFKFNDS